MHASHPVVIDLWKHPWYFRQCVQSRCTTTALSAPAYVGLIHSLTYVLLVTLTRIKHSRHDPHLCLAWCGEIYCQFTQFTGPISTDPGWTIYRIRLPAVPPVSLSGGLVGVVSGSSSYTDSSTLQANKTSSYSKVFISSTGATSASAPHYAS
ncbi:hypothetical protein CY34DRAFT_809685 [Suillus luteus UH-Slu-Lm8-n1]|uniref:Uncharacterized protein n=1 Tax=Suillus luteus UH-Slu-Lm8-n1 TaxID=930992 RepID=A0A0D0AJ35_9AGAM|nr:hypothetical protein CY34DRAFT_809685 [Suillus luteus UH-Slu-Lm8-n1]